MITRSTVERCTSRWVSNSARIAVKTGLTMLLSGNESILVLKFDVHGRASHEDVEVAQVYVGDSDAPVPRPPEELKGVAKVELRTGETKQVSPHARSACVLLLRPQEA
jgi:Fibronectin type III-like domain